MMTARVLSVLIFVFCLGSYNVFAEEGRDASCLKWDIKSGETVNKSQSQRLYLEAAHWLEERFHPEAKTLRPCLSIHIGESCPAAENNSECVSPASGDVYLPRWTEQSPGTIAQATVIVGMLQLVDQKEIGRLATRLLAEDRRDFIDVLAATRSDRR